MRAFTITRALNEVYPSERLIARHPSLVLRSLHNNIGGGRQTHIAHFQGTKAALAELQRTWIEKPPSYFLTVAVVQRLPTSLYVFLVERTDVFPLDVAHLVELHLGSETICSFQKSILGSTWYFVTCNDDGVPRFLRALARREQAWVDENGRDIPRYSVSSWSSAGHLAPPDVALSPLEETLLRTAWRAGYYEQPKTSSIAALARRLKLAPSTAHYHLKNAERKALGAFGGGELPAGRHASRPRRS